MIVIIIYINGDDGRYSNSS